MTYISEDATAYEHAQYELRRVDHLIYVSLKYTRTVDVIKNIIARMITTYDFVWDDLLGKAIKAKKLYEIPSAPGLKCSTIKKLYADDERIILGIEFYLLLRQLNNANYTAHKEFRRHVAMRAQFANGEFKEIDIDIITDYYKQSREFLEYIKEKYFEIVP
jgi:hypothetical protein